MFIAAITKLKAQPDATVMAAMNKINADLKLT